MAQHELRTLAILVWSFAWVSLHAEDTEPPRPPMTEGAPAAGSFVKQTAEEYRGTQVHHALYLPANWERGKAYPVIVEYAPNVYPQGHYTGRVEDCRMGYYLSGGRDFIWVVMPYVNSVKKENQVQWWGDEAATVAYCVTNLRRVCEQFGGDPNAVFLTGFSRGAIACGYIGLRDESIADVWLGFLAHSHMDGGSYSIPGSRERLARMRGRSTFITFGDHDSGKPNSLKGAAILSEMKDPFVQRELTGTGHSDMWIEQDSPTRREMRAWIVEVLKTRPGTHTVRGRVVDSAGKGVEGVRVQCGSWHWAITDGNGRYAIPSLVAGNRSVTAAKAGVVTEPERLDVEIDQADASVADFVIKP